jgi:hypothetical protein
MALPGRVGAVAVLALGSAATADIQVWLDPGHTQPLVAHFTYSMTECQTMAPYFPGTNQDGLIESGEGARIQIKADYVGATPGQTTVYWDPSSAPGSSGVGTLAGWWSANLDLVGNPQSTALGTWALTNTLALTSPNRLGVVAPFADDPGDGVSIDGGSRVRDIRPTHIATSIADVPGLSPTLPLWRGLWMPPDYTPRGTHLTLSAGSSGAWPVRVAVADSSGATAPVVLNAQPDYGFGFPIAVVPAPGALGLLAAGAFTSRHRRRLKGTPGCTLGRRWPNPTA